MYGIHIWILLLSSLVLWTIVSITIIISTPSVYEWFTVHDKQDYEVIQRLHNIARLIFPEVDDIIIVPNGDQTFTVNKNKIHLCLKNKDGTYYSDNMLLFALIHELAHVNNKFNVGHTEEWHAIFNHMLSIAHDEGIIDLNEPLPDEYCIHKNVH